MGLVHDCLPVTRGSVSPSVLSPEAGEGGEGMDCRVKPWSSPAMTVDNSAGLLEPTGRPR